jgi:hypothetical protein
MRANQSQMYSKPSQGPKDGLAYFCASAQLPATNLWAVGKFDFLLLAGRIGGNDSSPLSSALDEREALLVPEIEQLERHMDEELTLYLVESSHSLAEVQDGILLLLLLNHIDLRVQITHTHSGGDPRRLRGRRTEKSPVALQIASQSVISHLL